MDNATAFVARAARPRSTSVPPAMWTGRFRPSASVTVLTICHTALTTLAVLKSSKRVPRSVICPSLKERNAQWAWRKVSGS
jgi:hypothetical protein